MATCYTPKEGFIHNPLRTLPRNEPCPCGSGKKFKKCHLLNLAFYIPKDFTPTEAFISSRELEKNVREEADEIVEAAQRANEEIKKAEQREARSKLVYDLQTQGQVGF